MYYDSLENINQYSRLEVLKFLSFAGVMGTIVFLLNSCTLPAGMKQITGEVFINGRRIRPYQFKGTEGLLEKMMLRPVRDQPDLLSLLLVEMHFLSGETADWNLTLLLTGNKTKSPNSFAVQEQYFQFVPGKSVH